MFGDGLVSFQPKCVLCLCNNKRDITNFCLCKSKCGLIVPQLFPGRIMDWNMAMKNQREVESNQRRINIASEYYKDMEDFGLSAVQFPKDNIPGEEPRS